MNNCNKYKKYLGVPEKAIGDTFKTSIKKENEKQQQ
jgi:hypothetical protein